MSQITNSNILYPFTPSAEPYRLICSGIKDCCFNITADVLNGTTGTQLVCLKDYIVTPSFITLVFKVICPKGSTLITFKIDRTSSPTLITKRADKTDSVIIINLDDMPTTSVNNINIEIEPTKVIWQTTEVANITFINEERIWNINNRDNLAETILKTINKGDTLKLVDGYNCALSYDEQRETLTIKGIAGAGKGYPETVPWNDIPLIQDLSGLKSINGITGLNGNIDIKFSKYLSPNYNTDNTITIQLLGGLNE